MSEKIKLYINENYKKFLEKHSRNEFFEYVENFDEAEVVFLGMEDRVQEIDNGKKYILISQKFSFEVPKADNVIVISENLLGTKAITLILGSFIFNEGSLQLEDYLDGDSFHFEIFNIFESGYYEDLMFNNAYRAGHQIVKSRGFFTSFLAFVTFLSDKDVSSFPVGVDYNVTNDLFVIQAHFSCESFYKDYLYSSMKESKDNEYASLVKQMIEKTNYLEFFNNDKSDKVIMRAMWSLDCRDHCFGVYNIDSFFGDNASNLKGSYNLSENENLSDKKRVKLYEGTAPELGKIDPEIGKAENTILISKILKYFLNKADKEFGGIENIDVENLDFNEWLKSYFENNEKEHLSSRDHELLKSMFFQGSLRKKIQEIEDASKELSIESVLNNVLDLDESVRIKDVTEDLTEDFQLVKGSREDIGEERVLIEGSSDNISEEVFKIAGSKKSVVDEIVKVKSDIENEQNEFLRVKHIRGLSLEQKVELKKNVLERIDEELETDVSASNIEIVDKLFHEELQKIIGDNKITGQSSIISSEYEDEFSKEMSEKELQVKLRLINEKHESVIKNKDDQLIRMKNLLVKMKTEISNLREKSEQFTEKASVFRNHLDSGENISKEIHELKLKEAKNSSLALIDNKNKIIEELQKSITNLKTNSGLAKAEEENSRLQMEIRSLKEKLDEKFIEKDKVGEISSADFLKVSETEEDLVFDGEVGPQDLINEKAKTKLLEENNFNLKKENQNLKDTIDKLRKDVKLPSVDAKKEDISPKALDANLKKMAEKNKELTLAVKKYEQKLKFNQAQIDSMNKELQRKGGKTMSVGSNSQTAVLAASVKKLEMMTTKLRDENTKQLSAINSKKQEVEKFKSENTRLKNEILELERKLKVKKSA